MMRLIKMHVPLHRNQPIMAFHVVDEREWALIQRAIREQWSICFREVAGRHSEENVCLSDENVKVLTEDPMEVEVVRRVLGNTFGPVELMWRLEELEYEKEGSS